MALRYFQVSCRNCSQQFSIQAEEGITVKCNCPFCGTESTVAVPLLSAKKAEERKQKPHISSVGKKVIVVFLIFAAIMLLASTLLYVVFTAMSN